MSQDNIDQGQAAEPPSQDTKTFIRQDKIRIVLEGFRREVTVSDLCRREGIKSGLYYAWTKGFKDSWKRGKSVSPGTR